MIDREANRELFEEQVEIVLKAFNEESFSYRGKFYDFPPKVPYRGYELEEITLVPRPINLPVETWQPIVSASERALDFMVRNGIKGVIGGGSAQGGPIHKVIVAWRDMLAKYGRETELGTDLNMGMNFRIADTQEKAIKEAQKSYEEWQKMFGPLGFVPGLTDEQVGALADPRRAPLAGLPTLNDAVRAGSWLCGPPELIIERLMEIQEAYPGMEDMRVGSVVDGSSATTMVEQLEWFSKEVMPAFKAQVGAAAPAGD